MSYNKTGKYDGLLLIIFLALFLGMVFYTTFQVEMECARKGGVIMPGNLTRQCIKVEILK